MENFDNLEIESTQVASVIQELAEQGCPVCYEMKGSPPPLGHVSCVDPSEEFWCHEGDRDEHRVVAWGGGCLSSVEFLMLTYKNEAERIVLGEGDRTSGTMFRKFEEILEDKLGELLKY